MIKEVVYLAHDNAVDLVLKENGAAVDLDPVTRMVLSDAGCAWEVDSSTSPGAFDWDAGGGVLTLKLGDETVEEGSYTCWLTIYDPSNPDGIVWGEKIGIKFVAICTPE
jgi:hypothetical protein